MSAILYFHLTLLLSFAAFLTPLAAAENTKIKAIIFDFGGVIAKTDRDEVAKFIAKKLNISREDAVIILAGLKKNNLQGLTEEEYWTSYAKAKGIKLPADWLEQMNKELLAALKEIPGMVNLVKCLKNQGIQTALLSNVSQSHAEIKKKLGLYELFNPAILSYEVGIRKPDPKAYHLILQKLKMKPEEVIFIDNKAINIATAKSLGMDAIEFQNTKQLIEALKERGINCPNTQSLSESPL